MSTGPDHLSFIPGPLAEMIVSADGNHLVTADGRRILDAGGGAIVTNVGHGRVEVAEAAAASIANGGYVVPPWGTPERIALRDRLVEDWLPEGMERVAFVSGGSESVDAAIRVALAHQRTSGRDSKWRVIGRWPSYHGATMATLAAGGHAARRGGFEGSLADYPHVPWNDVDALERCIVESDPDTIAAFVAEPVIGAAGAALTPDDDYFAKAADVCRRHDVLFIADEVMTGFGRCGTRFGHELFGVTPDIMVAGKGLSGGYAPMGGVYATNAVVEPIAAAGEAFMYFTYGSSNVGCAISNAVLDIIDREGLIGRVVAQGERLRAGLHDRLDGHRNVSDIRGRGLLLGVEFRAASGQHFPAEVAFRDRVVGAALERDVWMYPAGSGEVVQDAVLLGPPFTITDEEVDRTVEVLAESIDAAVASL